MIPSTIKTWQMTEPGKLQKTEIPMPELKAGDVVVEISGCGVCHTDLSYFYMGVPTIQKPPLSLGHEISGVVIGGEDFDDRQGSHHPRRDPLRQVRAVPDRPRQPLPGAEDAGQLDGHLRRLFQPHRGPGQVPLRGWRPQGSIPLEHLSVIADAVTTPYQAALRAELKPGDRVIVIGAAGGVGSFMTQTAKGMGAGTVIGIDINEEKLEFMKGYGADFTINPKGKTAKEVREAIKAYCKEKGIPPTTNWKIFEVTGTKPGQELALALLSFTGKLIVVGYGTDETSYMLSR
jgi:6-hydroxycyclohex-1-ene-1-carbonyl-CoA dehydrogenase